MIIAFALQTTAASAEISAAGLIEAAEYIATKAKCHEVIEIIEQPGLGTDEEKMMFIALESFLYGYAYGVGVTKKEGLELLADYCFAHPNEQFAIYPD
ncbi:MAG: hypothetical protein ACSHW6_02780 [Sulfitobacter geojensis]